MRGVDLAVDVDHNPGGGAVGWFKELMVESGKLLAKVDWTKEGAQLIKGGKYRYFSPEFMFAWRDPATGKTAKNVLFGGSLTNRPFLKDMQPVAFSEGGMGALWMAEDEGSASGAGYDPDGDGDDDSTTDPSENPDWMQDVTSGITPWPSHDPAQQQELMKNGATKEPATQRFLPVRNRWATRVTERRCANLLWPS